MNMREKIVALTGASGFIGRHTIKPLIDHGYKIIAISTTHIEEFNQPDVTWIPCDLLDPQARQQLFNTINPTHLLHLAWYAVPGKYWESEENLRWVAASLDLALNFSQSGGEKAVFAGSCAEYSWSHPLCHEISTPVKPFSLYGTCKNSLRQILERSAGCLETGISWGRIFFLYGNHEPKSRLVPYVITSLLSGQEAKCSKGTQIRNFMHVEDAARAFVALLEHKDGGIFNVSSSDQVQLSTIINSIGEKIGREDLILLGSLETSPNEVEKLCADTDRLTNEVGFTAKISLSSGLDAAIDWWRKELSQSDA